MNDQREIRDLEKKVEENDTSAMYTLGRYHFSGLCGLKTNKAKGVRLFKLATTVDQIGNQGAESQLGYCLFYGQGIPRNTGLGLLHLGRATELNGGAAHACYILARIFRFGNGGQKPDIQRCEHYYKMIPSRSFQNCTDDQLALCKEFMKRDTAPKK